MLRCCVVLACAGWLVAQTDAPIRVATRLVEVSAVARDAADRPVEDLTIGDFRLFVNGKLRPISFFSRQTGTPTVGAPVMPANSFSNRAPVRAGTPAITILLLDALNTRFADLSYAQEELAKYIRESVRPEDRVCLLVLGDSLRTVQDFRGDPNHPRPRSALAAHAGFATLLAADLAAETELATLSRGEDWYQVIVRYDRTLSALEIIASSFRDVPGRKNLIWISELFPLPTSGFDGPNGNRTERVWKTFAAEDIAIYPIDAKGVRPDPRWEPSRGYSDPRSEGIGGPSRSLANRILASRSGGRSYANTNDLTSAIRSAVSDSQTLYTVAFYAEPARRAGKQHSIKLAVNRPGVNLRHRSAYYDEDPDRRKKRDREDREVEYRARAVNAVTSPVDASAVAVSARIAHGKRQNSLAVTVQTPLEGFGPGEAARYRVLLVQKTGVGKQFRGIDDLVEIDLDARDYPRLLKEGVTHTREIEREPEATQLRIVVQNLASGTTGSLTIPFLAMQPADYSACAPNCASQ